MADTSLITEIGVGGVFAVLVIREVLSFMAKRGESERKEQDIVGRAELEHRLDGVQFVGNCEQIVKRFDVMFQTLIAQRAEDKDQRDKQLDNIGKSLHDLQSLVEQSRKEDIKRQTQIESLLRDIMTSMAGKLTNGVTPTAGG